MPLPLFLIPIVVGLVAQSLKPLLNRKWYAHITPEGHKIPRYGGMPSAHTAFAASLVTAVWLTDGVMSSSFAIAAALLILILDDALRMRIFLSRHGQALHQLVIRLSSEEQKNYPYLEDRLGHRLSEVIAGGILGVILTLLIIGTTSML